MTAAAKDLLIEQGASFTFGFQWCHAGVDPQTPGDPYDLTGCTARMQIRKSQKSEALLDAKSDGEAPKIILGGATGRIDVYLTDQDTDVLIAKTALYDLEVVLLDGTVVRLLKGTVNVDPNITQDTEDPVVT